MNSNNLMNGEMVKNTEIEQPILKVTKNAKVFGKAITNEQAIARLVSRRKKAIAQNQRLKKYLNIKGEMELKENEKLLNKLRGFTGDQAKINKTRSL